MLSTDEIKVIKEYYTRKKKEFANRKSYYSDERVWGQINRCSSIGNDTYGFDLCEPYTLDEIERFELHYKIQLDPILKIYLTQISKEIFVYAYPHIFDLFIVNSIDESSKSGESSESDDLSVIIGIGGCSFTDVIYLNGAKAGTIWYDDGDSMMQIHSNFKEYITKDLIRENILKDPNNKQIAGTDFKTVCLEYNAMRVSAGFPSLKYSD